MGEYTDSVAARLDRIERKLDRLLAARDAPSVAPAKQDRFVSVAEFRTRSGLTTSTIYRMFERGQMKRPVQLSPGRVGWPVEYVEEWFNNRKKDS